MTYIVSNSELSKEQHTSAKLKQELDTKTTTETRLGNIEQPKLKISKSKEQAADTTIIYIPQNLIESKIQP